MQFSFANLILFLVIVACFILALVGQQDAVLMALVGAGAVGALLKGVA